MRTGLGFFSDHRGSVAVVLLLLLGLNVLLVLRVAGDDASSSAPVSTTQTASAGEGERWFVDLGADGTALRAQSGTCTTYGASVERSVDGGRTWTFITDDLRALVVVRRVTVDSATTSTVIGTRNGCETDVWVSADTGLTWDWRGDPGPAWYLRGEDKRAVHAPIGFVDGPCPARTVAREVTDDRRGRGVVVCSNGLISASTDQGRSWTDLGTLEDAWSASFDGDVGHALARFDGCFGIGVFRFEGGRWTRTGCIADAGVRGAALSVRGANGLVVSYSGTWLTADGGRTWSRVGSP